MPVARVTAPQGPIASHDTIRWLDGPQAAVALAVLGQLLQGLLYVGARPWGVFTAIGLSLVVVGGWLLWRVWRGEDRWSVWGLVALSVVQAVVLIAFLSSDAYQAQPPRGLLRWLVSGCLLDFLGLAVLGGLLSATWVLPARALLAVGSVVLSLWLCEGVLVWRRYRAAPDAFAPREPMKPGDAPYAPPGFLFNEVPSVPLVGGQVFNDEKIGWRMTAYSEFDYDYPSNPRGYFHEVPVFGPLDPKLWATVRRTYMGPPPSSPVAREKRLTWDTRPWRNADGTTTAALRYNGFPIRAGGALHFRCRLRASRGITAKARLTVGRPPFTALAEGEPRTVGGEFQDFEWTLVSQTADVRGALELGFVSAHGAYVDLEDAVLQTTVQTDVGLLHYTVRSVFNSYGFRDAEREVRRPAGVWRMVCLGDSFTEGMGVHTSDLFTHRLEETLNRLDGKPEPRYEVLNWGQRGYDTRQEREVFERFGAEFSPQVVLLVMVENDDFNRRTELLENARKGLGAVGEAFDLMQLAEQAHSRHAAHHYEACAQDADKLLKLCQAQGAQLAIVVFRHDRLPGWDELLATMRPWAEERKVPLLDLGESLLVRFGNKDLTVHPTDEHPNEIAHRAAAEALAPFLAAQGLLGPDPPKVPPLETPQP